jgi:predicted transcriptional regulator
MSKIITIVESENGNVVHIELDDELINFYKHETGKCRVTKNGITKFFQHLIDIKTYVL